MPRAQIEQGTQHTRPSTTPPPQEDGDSTSLAAGIDLVAPELPNDPAAPVSLSEDGPTVDNEDAAINPPNGIAPPSQDLANFSSDQILNKLFNLCVPGSNFEMGSLRFMRDARFDQYHEALAGSPNQQPMFLGGCGPRTITGGTSDTSGTDFDEGYGPEFGTLGPEPGHRDLLGHPEPTPVPDDERTDVELVEQNIQMFVMLGDVKERLRAKHKKWEVITNDFARRALIPSLISGNTVVDERNFKQLLDKWHPVNLGDLVEKDLI
jgi:hypothetical protein